MMSRASLIGWTFELDRIARVLAIAREEVAFRTLSEKDWVDLSRSMYGRAAKYSGGSEHNESGLFAFERSAIAETFPPPPASILVGACGGGRELFALVERGYRIAAAYDPVAPFIETLRKDPRLVESRERLLVGTHQAIESLPHLWHLREAVEPIDAVVVGWASYTHVLGVERRVEFLRSLRVLCPGGPVLLSFFVGTDAEADRPGRFRAQLRRRLGTTAAMVEPGDALQRGVGGVHYFTEEAFTSEVARAGYRVQRWQEHGFAAGHAVLLPEPPSEGA